MKKNIILLLAAIILSAGLFVSNQNVLAGSSSAQGGDPIGPCDGRGPYPDFCPTPTPQPQRADLAAAQLRHERNLPPRDGINSVQSPMHSSFSFFASILVLLGGIWAKPLAPTAATATVGGRVVTAAGRGVAQARITLTNAAGDSRVAVTNTFGYYGFADTPTGATYILSVVSKRCKFPQRAQVQSITDDRGDINFTAAP